MKIRAASDGLGATVRVDGWAGREEALLAALRRCRQSAWACACGECMNVDAMDARTEGEGVLLTLTPRPGTRLSPAGIEQCLGYLLAQTVAP